MAEVIWLMSMRMFFFGGCGNLTQEAFELLRIFHWFAVNGFGVARAIHNPYNRITRIG